MNSFSIFFAPEDAIPYVKKELANVGHPKPCVKKDCITLIKKLSILE